MGRIVRGETGPAFDATVKAPLETHFPLSECLGSSLSLAQDSKLLDHAHPGRKEVMIPGCASHVEDWD